MKERGRATTATSSRNNLFRLGSLSSLFDAGSGLFFSFSCSSLSSFSSSSCSRLLSPILGSLYVHLASVYDRHGFSRSNRCSTTLPCPVPTTYACQRKRERERYRLKVSCIRYIEFEIPSFSFRGHGRCANTGGSVADWEPRGDRWRIVISLHVLKGGKKIRSDRASFHFASA